jgi:hypothetical protein
LSKELASGRSYDWSSDNLSFSCIALSDPLHLDASFTRWVFVIDRVAERELHVQLARYFTCCLGKAGS